MAKKCSSVFVGYRVCVLATADFGILFATETSDSERVVALI